MSVYVDDMYRYPMGNYRGMKMSHMVADTVVELHDMATLIGVKRQWCQQENLGQGFIHYYISLRKRQLAVEAGAVEITLRQLAWTFLNGNANA